MREAVVLVHGLWSVAGVDLLKLRHSLSAAGYECHTFNYHVWGKPPAKIAEKLHEFIEKIDAPVIHIVAHSFGGIITLHLFDQFPFMKQGRVVLLAAPVNGSAVGRRISANPMTRWMLGQSHVNGLSGDVPEWKGWRDIGVIADDITKLVTINQKANICSDPKEMMSCQDMSDLYGIEAHLLQHHKERREC